MTTPHPPSLTRRSWFGSALLPALLPAQSAPAQSGPAQSSKDIVIASSNGLACCNQAMELLKAGADTLDAVIAGVNINEEDPEDNGVGYGGLPNEDGVVELDASVMHGPTRRAGAVAGLQGIKTPSKVAKLVMERTNHIMLVGEGALRFAQAHGFQRENLLTEKSRLAWLVWRESLRENWGPGIDAPPAKQDRSRRLQERFPDARPEWLEWALEMAVRPLAGTINCLALNRKGEMSGVTTTSGTAWKLAGRIGDSPIVGAGLYVDQDVGAAGSTGRGEENIRIAGAHTIVESLRQGRSAQQACLEALQRVSRNFDHDRKRLAQFSLSFYALRKDGQYGAASLWKGARFVVHDGPAARHEPTAYLYEK